MYSDDANQLRAALAARWWALVLRGALAMLFGAAMFVWPDVSLVVLVVFAGAWFLADGLLTLALASSHGPKAPLVLEGIVGIAFGLFTVLHPDVDGLTMLVIVAGWAAARGVLQITLAMEIGAAHRDAWVFAILGAASLVLAAVLLANMRSGALATLPLIAGFAAMLGVSHIGMGFWLERSTGTSLPHDLPTRR
jgi:uncharacterized membrane protein HdeD (DUF308 family)